MRNCEVCGDTVKRIRIAVCGHQTAICERCSKECPGVLEKCNKCENGASVDDTFDDDWRREIATQAGMGLGVEAYNDAMGYSVETYEDYEEN